MVAQGSCINITRNDAYDPELCNGAAATVRRISRAGIVVQLPSRSVKTLRRRAQSLDVGMRSAYDLALGYAVTVNKAEGELSMIEFKKNDEERRAPPKRGGGGAACQT